MSSSTLHRTATGPARERPLVDTPLVIAHRGASGYRPEHTLAAYALAVDLGADVIEPDLVSTRDGVLVARHENEISGTTDVADHPELAHLRTTRVVDGALLDGWFTEDLTLAELKTLRAVERIPVLRRANTRFDGLLPVPTFQEVVELARTASARTGRTIAVYPETKNPSHFAALGLDLEAALVAVLERAGWDGPDDPVLVQSFEVGSLQLLSRLTGVRLVQLLGDTGSPRDLELRHDPRTWDDLATPAGLREVARYAAGIGPAKDRVVPRRPDGSLDAPTSLVRDAHEQHLLVHPYTFRDESVFLPADLRRGDGTSDQGDAVSEYLAFYAAGVDGLFSDHPDTARHARALHEADGG